MMQEKEEEKHQGRRTRLQRRQQQRDHLRTQQRFSRRRLGQCLAVADLIPHRSLSSLSSSSSSSSCSSSSSSSSFAHHLDMTTMNEWSVIAGIKAMVLAHHPSFHWTTRTVDYNALSRFLAGTIDTVSPTTHTALSLFCALIEDVLAIRTLAEEQLAILDIDDVDTSNVGEVVTSSVPPDGPLLLPPPMRSPKLLLRLSPIRIISCRGRRRRRRNRQRVNSSTQRMLLIVLPS
jgi:hypothetical protein